MIGRVESTLCGLELDVQLGPVTAVLGLNGAGKSTLLNAIQFLATGQLAWPAGKSAPARKPADVVAALLADDAAAARVVLSPGPDQPSMLREIVRDGGGGAKITAYSEDTPRVGGRRPTPTQHATWIETALAIDPLAYSLAAWLERTGPQRVAELGDLAVMRGPTQEEITAALGTAGGYEAAVTIRQTESVSDEIELARSAASAAARQRDRAQVDVASALADLTMPGRAAGCRPEVEIRAGLARDRARQLEVAAALGVYRDRQREGEAVAQRAKAAEERRVAAERALAAARDKARLAAREEAAQNARPQPTQPDLAALEWDRDCAKDALAEAHSAASVAEQKSELAARAARDTDGVAERFLGGGAIIAELLGDLDAAREERTAEAVRRWWEQRRHRGEEARTAAVRAREEEAAACAATKSAIARAIEAERTCARAESAVGDARQRARDLTTDAAVRAAHATRWRETIAAVTPAESALTEAARLATEAREELDKHRLGDDYTALTAEAAALNVSVARASGELEDMRAVATTEARRDAAILVRERAETERVAWSEAEKRLQELRRAIVAEALAPLDVTADRIYHSATGGHVRFDPARGGVDLIDAAGRSRPLEAASTGERALAFPAISIALQRARSVMSPLILLDGLESCDARLAVLHECVRLRRAGELGQCIANWTAADVAAEAAAARAIDGVTVIVLGAQRRASEAP